MDIVIREVTGEFGEWASVIRDSFATVAEELGITVLTGSLSRLGRQS